MEITGRTRLFGILGDPVRHSLSPAMQNAAFEAAGMEACYVPIEVKPRDLSAVLKALVAAGFGGVNVTIPHKERVIRYLDRLSPEARLIGAVNTVVVEGRRLVGHNTDGKGFSEAFRRSKPGRLLQGRRLLVLGAGGAARAVVVQAASEGAGEIAVANRTPARAEKLIKGLWKRFPGVKFETVRLEGNPLRAQLDFSDVIVNTTSLGLNPGDPSPVPGERLSDRHIVMDTIYSPPLTPLLKEAQEAGAEIVYGLGMLLWQGAFAFELWTGKAAPVSIMEEALKRAAQPPRSN
jgi:shikimate dehydrogenase